MSSRDRGGTSASSATTFDPVTHGQRHGLSAEIARALWDRVAQEAGGADGHVDPQRARDRFEEVAQRVSSQVRTAPGKGPPGDGADDRRTRGDADAALGPGKVTRVETEGHHALEPVMPRLDGVPPLLASRAPAARSTPAGASTGTHRATLDVEALERRAVMLGVQPFVTPRWKELGGALFAADETPAAPVSPEMFAAQAYGLVLASPVDLFTAQLALSGPGRETYALALQVALQAVVRDRPVLEKLQADIKYLTAGGDLQFAATRILATHALASSHAKAALKEQGPLAADALAAYLEGGAVAHGIKIKRSELLADGVAPLYAESMALAGGPARARAVQGLARVLLAGAAPSVVAETHHDSESVTAEADALATMIRKTMANHRAGEPLSPDAWHQLDVALGAASPRARDLVWANAEVTGLLARALDPGQARRALGALDTVEALYESVRTAGAQAAPAITLAYGPPLPPPKLAAHNQAYPAIVAWLADRLGEENRALRNRLLQHVKLKTEVLDRLPPTQQRTIYRAIANGTFEPTAEDRLHEAAEHGRGAQVVVALRELASANPKRLAEIERDATFRASIERMRETVDVDGIPLRPYDVCLTLWGRDPRDTADPLLGAQRQVNLTGNPNPLSVDERLKLDDELFNPALADLHAQVANEVPKPRFAQMYAGALNPLPRAQAVLDRLRGFERQAAQEEFKHLLQREQVVAGAELAKRFGKRWNVDLRTWVYENGGPHIRSGVARILGTEHGASVGTFNGETVGLGETLPDKITLQQALRETVSGPEGWTISEWCSVVSRDMARAIEAGSTQKVLDAWRRLDAAIADVAPELERLTGRRIRTLDLLRNAMLEHGGHLEARITERFSSAERDALSDALGIAAANREDAANAPKPDTAQLANETYAAPAKQLWACLSALHAGSSVLEYVALGGLLTMVRHLPRLDASVAADAHAVEERPPRSFAAYYRAHYGTSVEGHVEAVLRAMPETKRAVPLGEAARLLGLDPQRLAAPPQATAEEPAIDEHNAHLVRAEFTVEDARGRALQIWQILRGRGRLETIAKQLYGDCNDEEQRLIRVAFRKLSGGYDLTFYLRQAIDAQQRRTAGAGFDGTLRSVPLPFADADHHVTVGTPDTLHVHGTASELDRALALATVGEVDIQTRLRAAAARDNLDHVFRTLEDASPAERTAILADGALVNRLKALGQWQWERCYKVLTNQADLADRLYSRSHGDGGLLERTFGGTHEGGMKEDLKGNATRLRLKYDAEVRAEIAHLLEKPEPREIDREVSRRVLEAAGINAADRSIDAILHSELSGDELAEMKAIVRNAGTARDWAVACGGGAKAILAEIRGLSAQQRAAKLRDPQYLRLLADRLSNERDYRDALNALGATDDADVTHGGGALARLDEASRSSAQVQGAERDRRTTLRALSELSPQEYERLRADPQLQLQVLETLSPDERALARDMLAFSPARAPEPETGDDPPALDTPADRDQRARERADFFVHQSVGRIRVACLRSWRDLLVQAAEVYKLDFALGFTKRGAGGHAEVREASPVVNAAALRATIWEAASPAVRAFAKEHQEHPGKKTRDAITGAQMIGVVQAAVLGTRDPSDALIAENIFTVDEKAGGDHAAAAAMREMVGADAAVDAAGLADALRAASDKHVAEQWTSICRSPAGDAGDTMQARYREVVATEAAANAHLATRSPPASSMPALPGRATNPATYAAAPQIDDPVLRAAAQARRRFLEYQIKIAQALEDLLLPYMGDDRRATQAPAAGQQQTAGRDNKRYNDLAEIILERIPQLPPEIIAATLGMKKEHVSLLSSDARRHAGEVYLRDQRDLRYRGEQTSAGSVAQDEKEILDEEQARLARHHAKAITDGEVTADEGQEYDRRYDAVDRAQEAHQAAKQAVASWASLIVGTVVTIAATVLTGGLATGPVAMMALAGATAALSATAKSLVMEEVLEGEWDREDAARMVATEVITGLVTMGTTYYAQRLLAAASGAATFAKQGAAVRQVLRRPPRLYQSLAHEAAEEMVSETMSGIVEAGLEAIDPTHWMHGYEEGARSARQAALARLSQVDDNALQGGVTAILTSVGGRIMKRARRGGGHVGADASSLDVPAKAKKRVDVVRNLKATLGDPGEKFMEALVQWGMQQDGPIHWAGAPSELLRGWVEEMGEASVEMHTGTVHKAKRDARAKAEIERAQGSVPSHELDDYARMQEGALDTDVFVSLDEHQRIRETVIHQGLADAEARGGFALTPAQREAFVAWVRTNAPRSDELVFVAATDPRTIPEVMNAASPPTAEPAAYERTTQQMPAVAAHERTTEQMAAVDPAVAPTVSGARDVHQDLPQLEHLAAAPAEMMLGAHQLGRIEPALQRLSDEDYQAFQRLLASEPNLVAQAFLFKALAANNSMSQIRWLAAEIAGKDAAWLLDNLTLGDPRQVGGGVRQQWSMSCNASMVLTLRGNYDPVFALSLRYRNMETGDVDVHDPDAANMYQADLEKSMLESAYGGGGWGAAGTHQGGAWPRAGAGGVGGGADDLLNALSSMTGVQYAARAVASPADALGVLDGALVDGIQVPVIVADPGNPRREGSHYLLAMARRQGSAGVEYQFHDTATGTTAWVSATDIAAARMPFGWPSIVGVEAPSTVGANSPPATQSAASTPIASTPGSTRTAPPLTTDAQPASPVRASSEPATRVPPRPLVVRSPGEVPASATREEVLILEEGTRRHALLHADPYFSPESADLAWAIFLRDRGITVPGFEIVDDVDHDRRDGADGRVASDGSTRPHMIHPIAEKRAKQPGRKAVNDGQGLAGEMRDDAAIVQTEYRDQARPANRGDVEPRQLEVALATLLQSGGIAGDVELVNPRTLRIRLGELDAERTIEVALENPADLPGQVATSDVGTDPGRVRVWISTRILDEHVPRALGGIVADVIARSSGKEGATATRSAREGELRALFARLQALEHAASAAPGGDDGERAVRDGRAETSGRARAELDVVLLQRGLLSPDAAAREAALLAIEDPELRRRVAAHVRAKGTLFDADAARRQAETSRVAPSVTPTDQAALDGQVSASSVLAAPPTEPIRAFTAADHARVVELRFHFEVIAELDQRLAARDQPGSSRGGSSPALGESLRRREHVARAKSLLAELQIGGTDPEFLRTRLDALTSVFPEATDIASAVQERARRRVHAVDAHTRAEAFRTARAQRMKDLADRMRSEQPFRTDRVIVGGGMAGTTRAAALSTPVGDDGEVDPTSLLMIGGDEMISRMAPDEYWGQRKGVFEGRHAMFRNSTDGNHLDDVVEDPGEFMHIRELNDSMDLARQRLGLVPLGARVLRVEVAKEPTPWTGHPEIHPDEYPVKVTIELDGERFTVFAKDTDITTGQGNTAMPNEGVLSPTDREELLGESLRGGERLMEKDAAISGRVLIVAFGPTGAWAARRALQVGAAHVDWAATGPEAGNLGGMQNAASIDRTQDAFNDARIQRTTDQIVRIDPDGDGAVVTYAYWTNKDARQAGTYKVRYDHVVMAQGFDSAGGRPSANTAQGDNRVSTIIGDMPMQPARDSRAPILENSGAYSGAVRTHGAAAWDGTNLTHQQRAELKSRNDAVARNLSSDSPDARTMEALSNYGDGTH